MTAIQKSVPALRFKNSQGRDYPDWKECMLDSVFSERIERGHVEKEMLSVTISNGVVRAADLDRHNNRPADISKYKKVNIGDLAYNSMRMWQGANGISEYEGVISPAYTVLIPKPNQHSKFWGFYFKTNNVVHLFQRNSQGLTSDTWNLKFPALSRIKLLVPNKKEQQKIADFLSSVDTKIKQLTKKKALLEQYKKGMIQKLFSQKIRFKDGQREDYPDWEERRLGEIARFSKGKGISKNDAINGGPVKCIRYGQLYTHYGETISNILSSTDLPAHKLVLSEKNDVIIPASGETAQDIATAACVLVDGVALGGDINIIRCQQNGAFLAYCLKHKKTDIARLAQGISVIHLYAAQLKLLKLRIPVLKEQQKIADFLSAIDGKIELVTGQIKQAQTFKKGLLQQMFM